MRITREKDNHTLKLSQVEYIEKALERLKMKDAKHISNPLTKHFKINKYQFTKTQKEQEQITKVPYASIVSSLMYAMVCTRTNIYHSVGVVSRFMSNPGRNIDK